MALQTTCPHCESTVYLHNDYNGQPVRCPECKAVSTTVKTMEVDPAAADSYALRSRSFPVFRILFSAISLAIPAASLFYFMAKPSAQVVQPVYQPEPKPQKKAEKPVEKASEKPIEKPESKKKAEPKQPEKRPPVKKDPYEFPYQIPSVSRVLINEKLKETANAETGKTLLELPNLKALLPRLQSGVVVRRNDVLIPKDGVVNFPSSVG